jgi:hypothetical protein
MLVAGAASSALQSGATTLSSQDTSILTPNADASPDSSQLSMKYKYPYHHPLLLTAASMGLMLMAFYVPGVGEVVKNCVRQVLGGHSDDAKSDNQNAMFIRGGETSDERFTAPL